MGKVQYTLWVYWTLVWDTARVTSRNGSTHKKICYDDVDRQRDMFLFLFRKKCSKLIILQRFTRSNKIYINQYKLLWTNRISFD